VGIPWRTSHEEVNGITNKLQYYFAAVAAEAEPVHVSLQLSPNELAAKIRDLDAFVLPGAPADVNPALYGAARHPKTHDADVNREKTDFSIIEHAFASAKPVLAICYGCQSLNVCLGGTLYQDIASECTLASSTARKASRRTQPIPYIPRESSREAKSPNLQPLPALLNVTAGSMSKSILRTTKPSGIWAVACASPRLLPME